MGLVQNQIEGAGVASISMTVQPHITGSIGSPRAVYIRFPAGNQLGEAGKPIQQRTILTDVLEAARYIKAPGTILELPYRWRRFPVPEEPVYPGMSMGPRHPQVEAMGEPLDSLVSWAHEYKVYLEERLSQEKDSASPIPGLAGTLQTHIDRVARMIEILDTDALDQLREITNPIATLELRASGKFV